MENVKLNPAALSKVNWAQAISLVAVLGTVFGLDLTPEKQAEILAAIATITPTVTLVFRTFFTGKASS